MPIHLHQYEWCRSMNHITYSHTEKHSLRLSRHPLSFFRVSRFLLWGQLSHSLEFIGCAVLTPKLFSALWAVPLASHLASSWPVQKALGFLQVPYQSQSLQLPTPWWCFLCSDAYIQASEPSPRSTLTKMQAEATKHLPVGVLNFNWMPS